MTTGKKVAKETVGKRVGMLRTQYMKLRLEDFADRCTLSQFTILKIENGETTNPYMDTVKKIANAAGVTVTFLLEGSESEWVWKTDRLWPPDEVILKKVKLDV